VKTTVADQQKFPYALAADPSGVYWLGTDGVLRRWTKSKSVETLATGLPIIQDSGARIRAHALALTSAYVVWLAGQEVRRIDK
jgi:hypothetical protein